MNRERRMQYGKIPVSQQSMRSYILTTPGFESEGTFGSSGFNISEGTWIFASSFPNRVSLKHQLPTIETWTDLA